MPGYTPDPLAGYSGRDRDFLERNRNQDGSYDFHRLPTAFVGDNQGGPFDRQGPMYDQATNQLSAAGRAALAARQQRQPMTLGALTGLAPVSRSMPAPMRPTQSPDASMTLGDWLQMTSRSAPDWRYLTRR